MASRRLRLGGFAPGTLSSLRCVQPPAAAMPLLTVVLVRDQPAGGPCASGSTVEGRAGTGAFGAPENECVRSRPRLVVSVGRWRASTCLCGRTGRFPTGQPSYFCVDALRRDVRRPRRPPEHEQASQVEAAQPARESFHQLLARQQEARRARERQHRDPDALEHLLAMHRDSIINRRQWWSAPLG